MAEEQVTVEETEDTSKKKKTKKKTAPKKKAKPNGASKKKAASKKKVEAEVVEAAEPKSNGSNGIENLDLLKDAEVIEIDPDDIVEGWRARQDLGNIDELAESIADIGQMQPSVVKPSSKHKGKYLIIAGMRRTRACESLGIKVKAVVVSPENEMHMLSMQLAENIKRKNFDRFELAEGLKRYKGAYVKLHPETAVGAAGRGRPKESEVKRFNLEAANALGVGEQSIRDLLATAELPKEKIEEIKSNANTPQQRNVAARKALAEVRRIAREEKLKEIADKKHAEREAQAKKKGKKKAEALYRCYHGENSDWLPKLVESIGGEVDLILTDPPYGKDRSTICYAGERAAINDTTDGEFDWDTLEESWILEWVPLLADNAGVLIFCPGESIGVYEALFRAAGLNYRGFLMWHKTNPGVLNRNGVYLSSCEALVYATKGKPYFKRFKNMGSKHVHNMFEGPTCSGDERVGHKTQKPLWLIERLIKRHTQSKDLVLDPFMGVGTTLVAATKYGRRSVGIDSEKKFVKRAMLRLKAV